MTMPMQTRELALPGVEATEALGAALAEALREGGLVTLSGELGAGKTTLVRALLRRLGHEGAVRSPTYAIVEPYRIGELDVFHLDLYRIAAAEELEYLGLRDWLLPHNLVLVEWPERGAGALPPPDLHVELAHAGESRRARLSGGAERLARISSFAPP
jgi:tRNA threonylcarbamoyladenosine biosynthesis protein TsaE